MRAQEETPFLLTQPPTRLDPTALSGSPRKAFAAAEECGWEARAWISTGEVAPTRYLANSNEHSIGEVKNPGYTLRMLTIEARDMLMPLGFRARYLRKEQASSNTLSGSFSLASVVDPVGLPAVLHADYKPIRQTRHKFETGESFRRREEYANDRAASADTAYNDGQIVLFGQAQFTLARDFEAWLSEWRSFTSTKKAVTHV